MAQESVKSVAQRATADGRPPRASRRGPCHAGGVIRGGGRTPAVLAAVLAALAVLVACTSPPSGPPAPAQVAGTTPAPGPARAVTTVAVPDGLGTAPFDRPR